METGVFPTRYKKVRFSGTVRSFRECRAQEKVCGTPGTEAGELPDTENPQENDRVPSRID